MLVGCPVTKREWILPVWFEHVETALAGYDFEYVFALDFGDESSLALIDAHAGMADRPYSIAYSPQTGGCAGLRNWHNPHRLEYMVILRNGLLKEVRRHQPDYFLSLDSDILITRESFEKVYDAVASGQYDACAGKAYLSKGDRVVTGASYSRQNGMRRSKAEYLAPVDVIMAYKLMNPKAYSVDYKYANLGEDIGWSLSCKADGLKLGYEGTTPVKHVMDPSDLDKVDKRVGY